jgi:hypothetical protein
MAAIISIVGSEMNDLRRRDSISMELPAEMSASASRARTQPTNGGARPAAATLAGPVGGATASVHDTVGLAPLSAPQGDELHRQVELLRA